MRAPSRRERIAAQLADLKMPGALEALDEVLAGVEGGGTTAAEAIERLLVYRPGFLDKVTALNIRPPFC